MPAIMHRATLEAMTLSFDADDLVRRLKTLQMTEEAALLREEIDNFWQRKAWYLEQLGKLTPPEQTTPAVPSDTSGPSRDVSFNLGRKNSFYAAFNEHATTFNLSFSYDDHERNPIATRYNFHIPSPGESVTLSHGTEILKAAATPPSRATTEIVTGQTSYLLYVTPIPHSHDCIWHLMYHRGIYLSKYDQETDADEEKTLLPPGTYLKVRRNGDKRRGGQLFTPTDTERRDRIDAAFTAIDAGAVEGLRYVPVWSTLFVAVDRNFGKRVGAMTTIHFTYP